MFTKIRQTAGTILFILTVLLLSRNPAGAAWEWLNPKPAGEPLNGVDFAEGRFLMATGNWVFSSSNGVDWTTHAIPTNVSLSKVSGGTGKFVAVGSLDGCGAILSSTDLCNWTVHVASGPVLHTVVFGNGVFVAAGESGTIWSSADGQEWLSRNSTLTIPFKSAAYGNGTFVLAAGDFGDGTDSVTSSPDGLNWIASTLPAYMHSVTFGLGRFYAGGAYYDSWMGFPVSRLYQSADGTNWSSLPISSSGGIRTVFVADERVFFQEDSIRVLQSSADGTNFSPVSATNFAALDAANAFVFGNGIIVGAGKSPLRSFEASNTVQISTNGTNWVTASYGPTAWLSDVAFGNGTMVAAGDGTLAASGVLIAASIEGGFTNLPLSPGVKLSRVAFHQNTFVAVGSAGTILRSTNGSGWISRNSNTGNYLRAVAHGTNYWVAVGDTGTIVTSPTADIWTVRWSGTAVQLSGVTWGPPGFVSVGHNGALLFSPDGMTWEAQNSGTLKTLFDVTFSGSLYVAVGAEGTIISSSDGIDWEPGNSGISHTLRTVAAGGGIFRAAGYEGMTGVLLISTNAVNWAIEHPGTVEPLAGLRFIEDRFLLVGKGGMVLQETSPATMRISLDATESMANLRVRGALGQTFNLERSERLDSTAWQVLARLTNAPSPWFFAEPGASDDAGFYRIAP